MRAGLLVDVFSLWFSSAINGPRQDADLKEIDSRKETGISH